MKCFKVLPREDIYCIALHTKARKYPLLFSILGIVRFAKVGGIHIKISHKRGNTDYGLFMIGISRYV